MAAQRDNSYGAFNFLVTAENFGNSNAKAVEAGFQEVSGLGMEVTEAEYRTGNDPENYVRKMNGIYKATDVTLKRGVIGVTDFFGWIKAVRDGDQNQRKTVKIELLDEAHAGTVLTWTLANAKPKSYKGPPILNAKGGTDVAIEELVLSCEKIDVE